MRTGIGVGLGLGAIALLAAGSPAVAAAGPPSPPDGEAPRAKLTVTAEPVKTEAEAGDTVTLTVGVRATSADAADVKIVRIAATSKDATIGGTCPAPFQAEGCAFGDLAENERGRLRATLTLPKDLAKTARVGVRVIVDGANAAPAIGTATITYTVPEEPEDPERPEEPEQPEDPDKPDEPSDPPGDPDDPGEEPGNEPPGDKPGEEPDDEPDEPERTDEPSDQGPRRDGLPAAPPPSTPPGYEAPNPQSSFGSAPPRATGPDVALPRIAPAAPTNATAPQQNRLRNDKAPVAQELRFERVASAQAAWLAVLLVVVSLLLTQVRLGRRTPAPAAPRRRVPAHRRPKRGLFGTSEK